jgi:NitT/TauT family transport system substrate-binding protein
MKTPLLHRLRMLGVGVAAICTLTACAITPATPMPTKALQDLKVGLVPATANAPITVPAEDGQFAAHGLNVSIETLTDPNQVMISAATGQFDVAYTAMTPAVLNLFNRGSALRVIAAGAAQPPGHGHNSPIVVRSQLIDSGEVKTVTDLRGRKVAISARGAGDYALSKALATGGLTESDVEVVTMPFPDMVVALSTGSIDAGGLLQPTAAQAVARGVGRILLDDYDQLGQGGVVVANSRFLEQHPDAVSSFLEVYLQAIRRLSDGKIKSDEQALAAVQKYTNVPPEVIRLGPDPYWPRDGRVAIDSLREQQAFYMRSGITEYSQPLEIEALIDYDPLDVALKNIGG